MEFSDLEILEATKTLYANVYGQAEVIAKLSADSISELALRSAIEGDSIGTWIAEQARTIMRTQSLKQVTIS